MAGYSVHNFVLRQTAQAVAASQTKQAVSFEFSITDGDSKQLSVAVKCSSVTVAAAISAILQDSPDGGTTWNDAGNVSVTADGTFEIVHNIADGTSAPLWPLGRVVVTTGAGDAVTVDAVRVTRRR